MKTDYADISKKIGKLTTSLMEYRYTSVLKTLTLIKHKNKRLLTVELELDKEIHKTIQNHVSINDLLDEIEALMFKKL